MRIYCKRGRWIFDSGKIHGRRVRLKFDTREQAEAFRRRAGDMRKKSGETLLAGWLSIGDVEIVQILKLRQKVAELGQNMNWATATDLTLNHIKAVVLGGIIGKAVKSYIEVKRTAGLSPAYVDRIEREIGAFAGEHEGKPVAQIVEKNILSFVDGLGVGDVAWNNRIRDLSAFFGYCKKKNWCQSDPTALIQRKKIVDDEVEVFTPVELAVMFWVSEHNPQWELTNYLAFGTWGTARCAEGFRLVWENVDPEEKTLLVKQAASKPNQRRVSEELPDVLFDWIGPTAKKSGPLCPPETAVEWRRAQYFVPAVQKILPEFRWKDNGLRKTSISVHFAYFKDAALTAAQHGTSERMIFRRYRKVLKRSEARPYFTLGRGEIVPLLRGLVPDHELDEWAHRHPPRLKSPPFRLAPQNDDSE